MIRWRFVITRLIIVIAVIVLLSWGLGPAAKFITMRALQSVTGAKVEIASTHVGLFPPTVRYQGVAIADPRLDKELRDAVSADTIELTIDGDALLRRRWVARSARVTGLKIGARRQSSGHFDQIAAAAEPASASDAPSMLSRMVALAGGKAAEQMETILSNSETLRQSQQIRQRWENEYERLAQRARNLEKQIRTVRDEARGIDNPLRDLPALERTLAQAREARNDLMTVRQEIDSLPQRFQADLAKLDAAQRVDLERIDRYTPGDLSDADQLGVDVVSKLVRESILTVQGYLDSGRKIANYTVVAPESERIRGRDHNLDQLNLPDMLVRRCEVGGVLRSGGKTYELTGIVENLTPTPESLVDPTRARLRLEGPEVVRLEYVRDCRNGADLDLLTLHWPQTDARPLRLGGHDAAIAIAGGQHELWVQIRCDGDRLHGRLVSKRTGLNTSLQVDPRMAEIPAVQSLQSSLAAIDRIEIDAGFDGTWDDLDLNLQTNLTHTLARVTRDAMDKQIQASRAQLASRLQDQHRQQSLELQPLAVQPTRRSAIAAGQCRSIDRRDASKGTQRGRRRRCLPGTPAVSDPWTAAVTPPS